MARRRAWKQSTWLSCVDPERILKYVRDRGASERKVRLFLAACCRARYERFTAQGARWAIEIAERYAEDESTYSEFNAANKAAHRQPGYSNPEVSDTVCCLVCDDLYYAVAAADILSPRMQCPLLREVFGIGREVAFDPDWRTADMASLAQEAYDRRSLPSGELDPARLAVLADALEDAGCADADLLGHLRSPGPHVRGCWALDLVLGRS